MPDVGSPTSEGGLRGDPGGDRGGPAHDAGSTAPPLQHGVSMDCRFAGLAWQVSGRACSAASRWIGGWIRGPVRSASVPSLAPAGHGHHAAIGSRCSPASPAEGCSARAQTGTVASASICGSAARAGSPARCHPPTSDGATGRRSVRDRTARAGPVATPRYGSGTAPRRPPGGDQLTARPRQAVGPAAVAWLLATVHR